MHVYNIILSERSNLHHRVLRQVILMGNENHIPNNIVQVFCYSYRSRNDSVNRPEDNYYYGKCLYRSVLRRKSGCPCLVEQRGGASTQSLSDRPTLPTHAIHRTWF